jgi:hypothetical protein
VVPSRYLHPVQLLPGNLRAKLCGAEGIGIRRASSDRERIMTMKTKTNLKAGIIAILIG